MASDYVATHGHPCARRSPTAQIGRMLSDGRLLPWLMPTWCSSRGVDYWWCPISEGPRARRGVVAVVARLALSREHERRVRRRLPRPNDVSARIGTEHGYRPLAARWNLSANQWDTCGALSLRAQRSNGRPRPTSYDHGLPPKQPLPHVREAIDAMACGLENAPRGQLSVRVDQS